MTVDKSVSNVSEIKRERRSQEKRKNRKTTMSFHIYKRPSKRESIVEYRGNFFFMLISTLRILYIFKLYLIIVILYSIIIRTVVLS